MEMHTSRRASSLSAILVNHDGEYAAASPAPSLGEVLVSPKTEAVGDTEYAVEYAASSPAPLRGEALVSQKTEAAGDAEYAVEYAPSSPATSCEDAPVLLNMLTVYVEHAVYLKTRTCIGRTLRQAGLKVVEALADHHIIHFTLSSPNNPPVPGSVIVVKDASVIDAFNMFKTAAKLPMVFQVTQNGERMTRAWSEEDSKKALSDGYRKMRGTGRAPVGPYAESGGILNPDMNVFVPTIRTVAEAMEVLSALEGNTNLHFRISKVGMALSADKEATATHVAQDLMFIAEGYVSARDALPDQARGVYSDAKLIFFVNGILPKLLKANSFLIDIEDDAVFHTFKQLYSIAKTAEDCDEDSGSDTSDQKYSSDFDDGADTNEDTDEATVATAVTDAVSGVGTTLVTNAMNGMYLVAEDVEDGGWAKCFDPDEDEEEDVGSKA
ncbi:hypothetical protein LTR36_001845 [Oleoguttula mirabilis]|uniref:Uncharacterized protein n=1 Tax=Oleoguttula mirabilis TaxID=1507867 RepID=A0AAV9JMY3_9PEZI|nr:hypothetical protein LTR36_001845 [Oleoguttula mirabilis]